MDKHENILLKILISVGIVVLFTGSLRHFSDSKVKEYYTDYSDIITWEADYDEAVYETISSELDLIPKKIVKSWIEHGGNIVVKEGIRSVSFENGDLSQGELLTASYVVGLNTFEYSGNEIISSTIYILDDTDSVKYSLIHEVGHFFYYSTFGMDCKNSKLPFYEKDCDRYCNEIRNGNHYLTQPKEYFADIFAYTIHHGIDRNYKDTQIMKIMLEF